ncbi:hypothetical protein AKG95_04900 [Janthinobacterium lividum]|jgi:hypothetical protein|uniref:Uncharacterized protein n=1 Tax=Janthinobacterium lividum TaxID=29581 RepID=A0A1S1UDS2_9BURK|nr:hypothetical protein AKG95_04900 [Janthinobacterium lividum]
MSCGQSRRRRRDWPHTQGQGWQTKSCQRLPGGPESHLLRKVAFFSPIGVASPAIARLRVLL